ncbi:PREDICTED: uncharacterized protein LOC106912190 [Poecilia mexicana]|uniref:uncharacterized protein LOC106912190 n=1 Tax=Poecilia mexicana TaxID=48701 RepID=UPI00072E4964|nr:PREDICTED: uncharacterized protein LOC106912190 [Poecilia mexicana]
MDVRPKRTIAANQHPVWDQHKASGTQIQSKEHSKHENITQPSNSLQLPGELLTIMSRQTEITAALVKQQQSMTLPPRDIPVFDGDPLQYRTFIKAFEQGVEIKATKADCLYYLEQFTKGQPRELVRSCQHMDPDYGYTVARTLLQEHFGNPYKAATAYINKALSWPTIRTEDIRALQSYSLFLRGCCNVMEELEYVQELNMPINMRAILAKLPYKLRECWRNKAYDIMETTGYRAGFGDMVAFIEQHVKILSDPFFGELQNYSFSTSSISRQRQQLGIKTKGNVVASTVTTVSASGKVDQQHAAAGGSDGCCVCCSEAHPLEECKQFKRKLHKDKVFLLRRNGLCFGCLQWGHISRNCEARLTCEICNESHPTVLHIRRETVSDESETGIPEVPLIVNATCGHKGAGKDRGMLSMLPVKVKAMKGLCAIQTYAFLDPGSTGTFCFERLMHQLNLTEKRTQVLLRTMGQAKISPAFSLCNLDVAGLESNIFYPLPEIITQRQMPVTKDNMITSEDLIKWPYLSRVHVPSINAEVDLLIGTNAPRLLEPWEVINSQNNGPYAVRTVLGWVVNGPLDSNSTQEVSSVSVNRISVSKLEELLKRQYDHDFCEESTDKQEMSREDQTFLNIMETSAAIQDGKYCLHLPFKIMDVCLPNNFAVAKQRLQSLRKRFKFNQNFHQVYVEYMNNIISCRYAERVPEDLLHCDNGRIWYIPHHGVYHPRKKSLRVVFDCAAIFRGVSLNSELLPGPNLTNTLLGVLMKFREESIAIMGDIKAMFHQVQVPEGDRDFLRFLWWPNGDITQEPVPYRMMVHLFGAVSSPSCAAYALRRTAQDNQNEFPQEVIETVRQNFYVDDCLKSAATEEEAINLINDLVALCEKGGFTLEKWISNSRVVLQAISEEQRAKDLKMLDLDIDKLPMERALGLQWCVETDAFQFKIKLKQQALTRRGMLSVNSSVYDPLGFLAPVTLEAKLMQQELCKRGCSWDDALPQDILHKWRRWLEELALLSTFSVNRCIKPVGFGAIKHAQLHNFSDASETGYGNVVYIWMINYENSIHVAFLMGKARVTPLKVITIPRVELSAVVLAVKVDAMVKAELNIHLEKSMFWTDSTSVLKYINNEDRRFHTFVANRIATIRNLSEPTEWNHVSTKENSADYVSRGLKVSDFLKTRKLDGPEFLWKDEESCPRGVTDVELDVGDKEVKKEAAANIIGLDTPAPTDQLTVHFSDWRRLKRAVAWYLRLKCVLKKKCKRRKQLNPLMDKYPVVHQMNTRGCQRTTDNSKGGSLSLAELHSAEFFIILYCQQQKFQLEIEALSHDSKVSRTSSIYVLDPVLENNILRVGGRLHRSAMPGEVKHPIILAKEQHISKLILRHFHQVLGHAGRAHTLSAVRKKFWITKANSAVRKVIGECSICRRYNSQPLTQKNG